MVKIIAGNLTLASNLEHQPLIVIFNFPISNLVIHNEYAYIVHVYMQRSLRVDGSILPDVFLCCA